MKDKLKETLSNILSYLLKVERKTLLWTNSTNVYGEGTVSLDLSDYDEVEILAAGFQTSNYVYSRCPVGKDGLIQVFTTSPDNASNASTFMNTASRHYTVSTTGITFNNGQMTYVGGAYQNWNSRAVPLKIYGIKTGGVLRKPVIAVLSAISKIGGGVDEGDVRKTAHEDTYKATTENCDFSCNDFIRCGCRVGNDKHATSGRSDYQKSVHFLISERTVGLLRNPHRFRCFDSNCVQEQLFFSIYCNCRTNSILRNLTLSGRGCVA